MLLTALLVVALALPAVAAAGDLDSTFSGDGKLRVGISGGASDVAIQGDGKAVAVGEAETSSPSCASTATGTLDDTSAAASATTSPSPPTDGRRPGPHVQR